MAITQECCEQSWTSPGGNTPQGTNYTATCLPSRKLSKLDWTRHAGHCWRSKDKLISDVLLWTPTYGWAKAERPARTYIQQLCEDTGCSPEDLPETMNDREKWWDDDECCSCSVYFVIIKPLFCSNWNPVWYLFIFLQLLNIQNFQLGIFL